MGTRTPMDLLPFSIFLFPTSKEKALNQEIAAQPRISKT